MLLVKQEEGIKALFKGFAPKVLRLGPGGAIMMIAYEEIYKFLKG
jgi:solute carrier family 25 (mitochondrial 2-oxodicarboxylate transporter), member 21